MYEYVLQLPLQEAMEGAGAYLRSTRMTQMVILVIDNDHHLLHST